MSQRSNNSTTNPSPPTYRGLTAVVRPGTPSHNPSLDDLRRKLIKFTLPDEGKSTTLNVADCNGGVEMLTKALKKFNKLGADSSESISSEDGGLSIDGWGAFLDWGHGDTTRTCFGSLEIGLKNSIRYLTHVVLVPQEAR